MCTLPLYSSAIFSALHSILATSLLSLVFPGTYREDERNMLLSSNVYTSSWLQKKEIGKKLLYIFEESEMDHASYNSSTVMIYCASFLKDNTKFISCTE